MQVIVLHVHNTLALTRAVWVSRGCVLQGRTLRYTTLSVQGQVVAATRQPRVQHCMCTITYERPVHVCDMQQHSLNMAALATLLILNCAVCQPFLWVLNGREEHVFNTTYIPPGVFCSSVASASDTLFFAASSLSSRAAWMSASRPDSAASMA